MSTVALAPPVCAAARPPQVTADQLIRQVVNRIFQMHHPLPGHADRRCDRREPYPYPIRLTPLDPSGSPELDKTIVVLGKHLSERGLDFYYGAPVPYRRAIISVQYSDGRWLSLLIDLRWCRSNGLGWYENGGRFLRVVTPPLEVGATGLHGDAQTDFAES